MAARERLVDRVRRKIKVRQKRRRRALSWADEVSLQASRQEPRGDASRREPDASLRDNPLDELAERYRPSKRAHDYMRHYWAHFRDRRETTLRLVEIGVETDRSIKMWEEFFPNAEILGIDIDPECKRHEGGRRRIFTGDQLDEEFLHRFVSETGGSFDIVIDDGLHTAEAILTSFSVLFPALAPRGVYAVEDIIQQEKVVEFFGSLLHRINHYPGDGRDWPAMNRFDEVPPWLTKNVSGLSFYRYLCFVQRGFNPEENPHLVDPKRFQRKQQEAQAKVREIVANLVARGVEPTRDALRSELGHGWSRHIDDVLAEVPAKQSPRRFRS